MGNTNNKINWTPLIVIIVLFVLSIIMMAVPDFALDVIVVIPAIAFLVYGVVAIIYYAVKKDRNNLKKSFLLWPIIALAVGILMLVFLKEVKYILPIFIGAWLIATSIYSFITARKIESKAGFRTITVLGIIQLAFGIVFIVVGFGGWIETMVVVLGAFLFVYSIISIVTFIVQARVQKKLYSSGRVK